MTKPLVLIITLLTCAFWSGWKVNGFYHDSLALTARKTADKIRVELETISRQAAAKLEEKLEGITHAAPREIRTEIIKPVFTHLCVSDDFVRMYNETANNIERELSGKSAKKMRNGVASPDRKNRS